MKAFLKSLYIIIIDIVIFGFSVMGLYLLPIDDVKYLLLFPVILLVIFNTLYLVDNTLEKNE